MATTLFYAKLKLDNGDYVSGPVTTEDNNDFLFRNTGSDLDLYFSIKKNRQLIWEVSFGPNYEMPKTLIRQLANQIDYYKADSNDIELMADGILPNFVPKDSTVRSVNFDFLMLPNLNLRVYYEKKSNMKGEEFWKFQGSKLLHL